MVAIEAESPALRGLHGSSHLSVSFIILSSIKGGFVGAGRWSSFFVNICSAFDIVGRNDWIFWVHRSPICTTLKISFLTLSLGWLCKNRFGSYNCSTVPDRKCFHACFVQRKKKHMNKWEKKWKSSVNSSFFLEKLEHTEIKIVPCTKFPLLRVPEGVNNL